MVDNLHHKQDTKEQLDRIEKKLDELDKKLDIYYQRYRVWLLMKLLLIFAVVFGTMTNDEELLRPRPRGGPAKEVKIKDK